MGSKLSRLEQERSIIGMTVNDATVFLKRHGSSLRVTKEDGESLVVTMDLIVNRLNVESREGKIVRTLHWG
jgi:hypothetical protein